MAKRDKIRKRISTTDREKVLRRDHYLCGYCGMRKKPSSLAIDHIIPVHYGGYHGIENFVAACRICNRKKWHFAPREQGAPKLMFHSGRKVAKLTWLAKSRKFPARVPTIAYSRL